MAEAESIARGPRVRTRVRLPFLHMLERGLLQGTRTLPAGRPDSGRVLSVGSRSEAIRGGYVDHDRWPNSHKVSVVEVE